MCCGPRRAEEKKHVWGGSNPEGKVHGWHRWGDTPGSLGRIFMRWLLLASAPAASLRTQRCAVLMDRLGRRGGLFLDWTSADFGDGELLGNGELSEDNSSSVDRSMSLGTTASLPLSGRDGGGERGGPRDVSAWQVSNRVHRRSLSSCNRFACSLNSATSLACSSCLASIS